MLDVEPVIVIGVRRRKSLSPTLRFQVLARDAFTCQYCGGRAPDVTLQVDHMHAVAKGGQDTLDNLLTSCSTCNIGKRCRTTRHADDTEEPEEGAILRQAQQITKAESPVKSARLPPSTPCALGDALTFFRLWHQRYGNAYIYIGALADDAQADPDLRASLLMFCPRAISRDAARRGADVNKIVFACQVLHFARKVKHVGPYFIERRATLGRAHRALFRVELGSERSVEYSELQREVEELEQLLQMKRALIASIPYSPADASPDSVARLEK